MAEQTLGQIEGDLRAPLNPIPPELAPINLMQDGGMDDDPNDDTVLPPATNHTPPLSPTPTTAPNLKADLNLSFVSAVGSHAQQVEVATKNIFGKKNYDMKSQELLDVEKRKYGGMKMSESMDKREGPLGKKVLTFFERVWKTTFARPLHEVKEARVGGELMVAAGINTSITAEFDAVIDAKAREKIDAKRDVWYKKLGGNIRDLGNELIGREKELHREKIAITSKLRSEYLANPGDKSHPFAQLLHRDMLARESLAEKFATAPADFLHAKDLRSDTIDLDPSSEVAKFLKENVFKDVINDTITQIDAGKYSGGEGGVLSEKARIDLDTKIKNFFFTNEFTTWRNSLPEDQRKQFENSLTYSSNVLSQAESVIMPLVHQNLDHFRTNRELDFNVKLTLGTGQFGPNSELVGISRFSKERISKNDALYEKLRAKAAADPNYMFSKEYFGMGLAQTVALAGLNAAATSEMVAAVAGVATGRGLVKLLHMNIEWIPVVGGLFAGGVAGYKEYKELGKMRERFGEQVAEGYTHPSGINAVRAEALRRVDYHRVDLGIRALDLKTSLDGLKGGDQSEATILKALGQLADSKARVSLSDRRHINLFRASADTPDGRANYQQQDMIHAKLRARTTEELNNLFTSNDALRQQIAIKLGYDSTFTTAQMLDSLSASQAEYLEKGTTVNTQVQLALGAITPADAKSIDAQDKAFNKYRRWEVTKKAAVSGVLGGLATWGLGEFATAHQQVVTSNVEHQSTIVLDHTLPSHVSPVSIGEVQDPSTHEIISTMNAHVPDGTMLQADIQHPGAFDLVLANDPHRVLVDNMTFTDDGQLNMTTEVREALAHSHINYHAVNTGEVLAGAHETSFAGTENLTLGELPGAHEAGFNQWFANTLNHSYSVTPEPTYDGVDQIVVDRSTQVNGIKELLYGWEDYEKSLGHNPFDLVEAPGYHQVIHYDAITGRALSEPQAAGFMMNNVPTVLATEEGHRRVADFITEAVRTKLSGGTLTDAQQIAFDMSYVGDSTTTIPTPAEFEIIMKALGETTANTAGAVPTHDAFFTMTGDLIDVKTITHTDVVNHAIPSWVGLASTVGYSVPLEAPIGRSLRHDDGPESSPYGPYGRRSRVEDEYRSYYPGKEPDWGLYHSRRSPRLNANPDARLDLKQESDWYFGKIEPEYRSRIQSLAAQTVPMNNNVKAVVCMPVAAHQEESNIYNTLTRYTNQVNKAGVKLDPSTYEIFIYLNHPENKTPDGTEREIQRFQRDFPDMPIRVIKETLKPKDVLWGKIVGAMNDTILYRSNQRTNPASPDYVMLTNDADMTAIAPTYIDNFVTELEKPENAHIDGMLGKLEWSTEAYDKYPVFHAATRFWQYVDNITRHGTVEGDGIKRPNIGSPGATFGIRASTYAGIGGYLQETGAGADQELSWMIKAARGADNSRDLYEDNYPIKMLNTAWLESSPRRGLDYYLQGKPIVNQWADWDQRAKNSDPAREKKFADILGAGESLNNFSVERLESEINALLRLYGYDADTPVVKRALGLLGASFTKDPSGKVKLTNIDKLLAGLKDFKDKNRSQIKKAHNQAPRNP